MYHFSVETVQKAKTKIVTLEYTIKIKHYQLTLKWYVPKNLKNNELTVKTAGDNNEEIFKNIKTYNLEARIEPKAFHYFFLICSKTIQSGRLKKTGLTLTVHERVGCVQLYITNSYCKLTFSVNPRAYTSNINFIND